MNELNQNNTLIIYADFRVTLDLAIREKDNYSVDNCTAIYIFYALHN